MARLLRSITFLMLPLAVQLVSAAAGSAGSEDFAGLVDIGGGGKMYLECRGTGSPTVVLVAGLKALSSRCVSLALIRATFEGMRLTNVD